MTNTNPLQKYFRQATTYIQLPTQGRWYNNAQVVLTADNELAVYALTARDDILLNTPDAMLNGMALKKVIQNCVPDVVDVDSLLLPDLEAIFVAMKLASNDQGWDITRICPKCNTECTWGLQCQPILDTQTYVEDSDCWVLIDDALKVNIKPYNFQQRALFIQKQFEEERALKYFAENNPNLDEFQQANVWAQAVDRISSITFELVSQSITSIEILDAHQEVYDPSFINEWLQGITKSQAEIVLEAVDKLNKCGPSKTVEVSCTNCEHQWTDEINYDPISFFVKRS